MLSRKNICLRMSHRELATIFLLLAGLCGTILSCKPKPSENLTVGHKATSSLNQNLIPRSVVDSSQLNYLMGKFIPEDNPNFVAIPESDADRTGMYMRKEAYAAFQQMKAAALNAGVELQIRSAARNFDYQKGIWERKWTGETILSSGDNAATAFPDSKERAMKILEYSSMPGTSRHHWGTDIDLNNFNNSWFETGEGLKLFEWLEANAHNYGYCRPYTAKDKMRPNGYNEEKWHWSYTPISDSLTQLAETHLTSQMIQGFMGDEVSTEINVVNNYVLGINQGCVH